MVSIRPQISNSSSPFTNPWGLFQLYQSQSKKQKIKQKTRGNRQVHILAHRQQNNKYKIVHATKNNMMENKSFVLIVSTTIGTTSPLCSIAFSSLTRFRYLLTSNPNNSVLIICLPTVKWLQVLLFNTNYLIENNWFICTQSNASKYYYVILIIQFRHKIKDSQVWLFNTILFNITYSFAHN